MWKERVDELRRYVDSGMSRAMIAQIYGVTRNAAVGACYRYGITGPNNQIVGAMVANERRRRANAVKPLTTRDRWRGKAKPIRHRLPLFPEHPEEPEPLRISLLDLDGSHCHWVCDGTDDHCLPTYCGHPSVDGRWCAHHRGRVFV